MPWYLEERQYLRGEDFDMADARATFVQSATELLAWPSDRLPSLFYTYGVSTGQGVDADRGDLLRLLRKWFISCKLGGG